MDDTQCKEKCAYVKIGFIKDCSECPNFVESWWQQEQQTPKIVRDCAPKRLMLQLSQLLTKFEGVQVVATQNRNETLVMKGHLADLIDESKKFISIQESLMIEKSQNLIEDQKDG